MEARRHLKRKIVRYRFIRSNHSRKENACYTCTFHQVPHIAHQPWVPDCILCIRAWPRRNCESCVLPQLKLVLYLKHTFTHTHSSKIICVSKKKKYPPFASKCSLNKIKRLCCFVIRIELSKPYSAQCTSIKTYASLHKTCAIQM